MNQEELRKLIASDKQATELFEAGVDNACAERCTEIAPTLWVPVPCGEVKKQAALSGAWAKIKMASRETSLAPDQVKGVCITFVDWIDFAETIDFQLPEVQGMAQVLIGAKLITKPEYEKLIGLGQKPQVVSHSDIANLRE